MKATTIAVIAAALVAVYFLFRNNPNFSVGATSHGATVAGGVPSLLGSAATNPGWVGALEGLFSGIGSGGAAAAVNENSGSIVSGGASVVQANANAAGFGSGGSSMGLTATQISGATAVEASDENLASLLSSGGITTNSNYGVATSLDLSEDPSLASFSDANLPLSSGYDANNYSALLA